MTNQHDEEMREAFERGTQWEGDCAKYSDGDYVNEVQQNQWEAFKDGYQSATTRYEAALREAREALESFQRGNAKIQVIVAEALATINEILGEK